MYSSGELSTVLLPLAPFILGLKWGAFGIALLILFDGVFVRVPLLFWFAPE
jgi:hypothetical protein